MVVGPRWVPDTKTDWPTDHGRNINVVVVNLRPTVTPPGWLGVGLPSGAHDRIFLFSA
jgi:hypothetical protein